MSNEINKSYIKLKPVEVPESEHKKMASSSYLQDDDIDGLIDAINAGINKRTITEDEFTKGND